MAELLYEWADARHQLLQVRLFARKRSRLLHYLVSMALAELEAERPKAGCADVERKH